LSIRSRKDYRWRWRPKHYRRRRRDLVRNCRHQWRAEQQSRSRLLCFRGKSPSIFRGAVYPRCSRDEARVRVPAFAYRTTLRVLPAPNHISPTSPWSWKLSSSCAYAFSQLRQERTTRGSEKRRVMHNGCRAVTVRITHNSRVPRSDDVNSSPVRSVIIPLRLAVAWCRSVGPREATRRLLGRYWLEF